MSIDEFIKLLDAITKLLNVLVWPGVLVFILIQFGSVLREFLKNLGEFSLKGAGFEAAMKRRQTEAAAALAVAGSHRDAEGATPEGAASTVAKTVTPQIIRQAGKSTVLWVDDNPNNNIYERQALEALGLRFVLALSTEEALDQIKRQRFDVIISDMGRPPDARAGYTLLDKLRSSGDRTPFIIYASSRSAEHVAEARQRGAVGCTNRPDELFEMVLSAIGHRV